jgi:leucyl/phenylalanyl-tRNA---protein transferase
VMENCGSRVRPGQESTWIHREMIDAYEKLFELGFAHSAESYLDGRLVGGLYGVALGGVFFGESMFAYENDASKIAFVTLIRQMETLGITLVDCQMMTAHLARFGAVLWPRDRYLNELERLMEKPTARGHWSLGGDASSMRGDVE